MTGDYVQLIGLLLGAFAIGYASSHQLLIFKKTVEVST